MQAVVTMAVVCLPAGQFLHVDEAIAAAYLPAMQSTQVVALVAAVAAEALPVAPFLHVAVPALSAHLPGGPGAPTEHAPPPPRRSFLSSLDRLESRSNIAAYPIALDAICVCAKETRPRYDTARRMVSSAGSNFNIPKPC